jgi:predicted alpha-1,2-mannosidase
MGAVTTTAHAAGPNYVSDPASLVNPLIGTSGYVDDFPGADVPFGMVQWSPDTPSRPAGGGYEYTDKSITGFSLDHISGPGCSAFGDIPVLPTVGAIGSDPGSATAAFDHANETAQAGYYSVQAGGVTTELTATTRSGMGRFTFPAGDSANLLFKLSGSAAGVDATHFQMINDHEVAGSVESGHFCGADDHYTVSFDMQFDQPIVSYGTWKSGTVSAGSKAMTDKPAKPRVVSRPDRQKVSGPRYHGKTPTGSNPVAPKIEPPVANADGAYVTFDTSTTQSVQAKVGLSFVGVDNARANLQKENPGWNFAVIHKAAHSLWNTQLNKIQVAGENRKTQRMFYTALYHALLHPNVFSDINGEYMGFDDQVHHVSGTHLEYANFSGWDIYRTQVQLMSMLAPNQASDEVRSMLDQYDQTGQLPKWELANGESYVMVGDPADSIIADAYAFGARDFDTQHALDAMLAEANKTNNIRPGLNYLRTDGYLPMDGTYGCCNFYGPVSTQLEYDTADFATASFAKALGDTSDYTALANRAQNWQNVFNPGSGFVQPKNANGTFQGGFSPSSSAGMVEGTAAQYTPMVPFDVAGLATAAGGRDAWTGRLDTLMANIATPTGNNADLSNEPSFEIPWEYDYVGAPYKAQQTVRAVQQQIYSDQPAGMDGNDDLGTMSAWYVWSALGMYPETPGTATMALGSPLFTAAKVHLGNGRTLTITAPKAAQNAPYIQSATLNGKSWTHAYLPASTFSNGGTFTADLGTAPNTSWGAKPADAPPSYTDNLYPALGYTDPGSQVIAAPGKTATVQLGLRSLSTKPESLSWTSSGASTSPASGTIVVPAGGTRSQSLTISAPSTEGRYLVRFAIQSATGIDLPDVVIELDVAKPGELWPYYNNIGVSDDGTASRADYDGDGFSYSAQQLATQGITPGGTVSSDGLTYTWPDVASGEADNIAAGGQQIPINAPAGATQFGLLGSAVNASPGAQGDFVVTYTDGSTQTVGFGLSDWTLGAGGFPPAFGNTTVATTAYRNTTSGGKQDVTTYLFTAHTALQAGKTVASIRLPTDTDQGTLHVFAFGFN